MQIFMEDMKKQIMILFQRMKFNKMMMIMIMKNKKIIFNIISNLNKIKLLSKIKKQ